MKRSIFIFIISLFVICFDSSAQSYEKMWDNISVLQKKGLPRSVVEQATEIFNKASKEKNSAELIKSFITMLEYRKSISPDSLNVDLNKLEQLAIESKKVDEQAWLYSILASLTLSSDKDKYLEYIRLSMKDVSKLVNMSDDDYKSMVIKGKLSDKYFKNNLLHLISNINFSTFSELKNIFEKSVFNYSRENIISQFETQELKPKSDKDYITEYFKLYQTLLREYRKAGLTDAWIITAADVINDMKLYNNGYSDVDVTNNLKKLINDYSDYESVAYAYTLLLVSCEEDEYKQAYEIIQKVYSEYPNYAGMYEIKEKENTILSSSLSVSTYGLYANIDNKIRVTYRNISSFKMNLYRVNNSITPLKLYNERIKVDDIKSDISFIKSQTYQLTQYDDFKNHNEELELKIETPGIYYIEVEAEGIENSGDIISITSFLPLIHPLPNGKTKIVILDALNGKPVKDALLNLYTEDSGYRNKLKLSKSISSDADGVVYIESTLKNIKYNITKDDDRYMAVDNLRNYVYRVDTDYKKERVAIFTDRQLYKPGQIVNFSGFAYTLVDDSTNVLSLKEYEVTLSDANQTKISSMNVTTDRFGAFSGKFTLPTMGIKGDYCIKIISCKTHFRVEEYKRPSFQVEFMPIEGAFSIGDTVNVVGYAKTLWGMPLNNVTVKYRINGFGSFIRNHGIEYKEMKSDNNGRFIIPVVIRDDSKIFPRYWYKKYKVNAIVTDTSGESVENNIYIPYGSSSLTIECSGLNDVMLKENNDTVSYIVKNLYGQDVDVNVLFKLYKIDNNSNDSTLIIERSEQSNKIISADWIKKLSSGKYRVVLRCSDSKNRESEYKTDFTLFSLSDKRPPVYTDLWIYDSSEKKDIFSFGTSKSDADIYFTILGKDKIFEDKVYTMSDSIINFDCSYKGEYGDGAEINIAFVKEGKVYTYGKSIIKPIPSKKLILKWETFRDKLQPGKQEEWKLRISYPDKKVANAQLMTTMYDASLDEIAPHNWNFDISFTRDVNSYYYRYSQGEDFYLSLRKYDSLQNDERYYSYPNLSIFNRFNYRSFEGPAQIFQSVEPFLSDKKNMTVGANRKVKSLSGSINDNTAVRKNFSETAFFYPQLNTDKNGVVTISFSLPESLTKWNFIGLAHTQNVDYGIVEASVVSFKEFMVKPDLPRFVRSGDRLVIPVSVTNLKDNEARGDLYLDIIDPLNNKVIYSASKKFRVLSGGKSTREFEYLVPDNYSMLICRVVGKGKKFSDGEQHYIPLLSDKEMVTTSVPMVMNDMGKHNFKIESSKNKRLTLEVTANPIWHVVQSLPSMINPRDEFAYCWAASLYATSINDYIINNNKAVHNILSTYKSLPEVASKEMLSSELQKNQELKEIILSETPWVAQANREENQRKLLTQIADVNYINYNKQLAVEHLLSLQNGDGSWGWYKGMGGNVVVTADILELLAKLKMITGKEFNQDVTVMYNSAFRYLNDAAINYYRRYKELNSKKELPYLNQWIVKYLYICSIDKSLNGDSDVCSYFVDRLIANNDKIDIYNKSISAVVFYNMGLNKAADEFIESILQYTVYSKDLGRYFDTNRAWYTYSANIIPSVASTIEALKLSGGKEKYIDEMKQWLIAMKGVQSWSTNEATVNAIYALIADENILSDSLDNGYLKINAGSESFKIDRNEPLGYIKREIDNSISNVVVEKTFPGISYGAVYVQGLEKVDTLSNSSTGLSIKKSLYRGEKLIDGSSILNVGDVIRVRLTIYSPINMDFVQIKDPLYSCMQPREQLSSLIWNGDIIYNKQIKNASVNLFIDKLKKGTHTIEYDLFITKKGTFGSGLTIAESAYFPMLRTFASSQTVNVE